MKRITITGRIGTIAAGAALLITLAVLASGPHAPIALADHKEGHNKGGGGGESGGGDSQDLPVCVTINDNAIYNVRSDGWGNYCDSNSNHVTAHIGRSAGQFRLNTNTNLGSGGRTMRFFFPPGTNTSVFGDVGTDVWPFGFSPIGVDVRTARPQVTPDDGYVDLRTLTRGQSAWIAVRISLVKDKTIGVNLHYGDILWPSTDPNSKLMNGGSLATVVGGKDTDGDGFSDSWTISGSNASVGEEVGGIAMPFEFTIIKQ